MTVMEKNSLEKGKLEKGRLIRPLTESPGVKFISMKNSSENRNREILCDVLHLR